MSAERERIKRAMGIGEHPGTNDLNQNEFRVTTYIHAGGQRYEVTEKQGLYYAKVHEWTVAAETIEMVRERAVDILAASEEGGKAVTCFGVDHGHGESFSVGVKVTLEARKFTVAEVCEWFGVPPPLVAFVKGCEN